MLVVGLLHGSLGVYDDPMIMIVVSLGILYGATMKIADLLNEHGLKWFKGSNLLFGVLWGLCGALLIVLTNPVVDSALVAMNVAFIIRNRLDYLNHQVAASIVIVTGIAWGELVAMPFLVFFFVFLIFGALKDYADDVLHAKGLWALVNESMLYYPIPTLIYAIISGDWLPFAVFTAYMIAYNLTKIIAHKKGYG